MKSGKTKMYMVAELVCSSELKTGRSLELSWADNMIGVVPVFTTKKAAIRYADGRDIVEVEVG